MKGKEKTVFLALIVFLLIATWIATYFEETVYYFPKLPKPAKTAMTDLSDKAVKPEDD